jgi:hypothetical protein
MRTLSQSEYVWLWERGKSLHPLDKGVLAVTAAYPETDEPIADWPLGRRNRALAEFHVGAFGGVLCGWTRCEQCSSQLEFQIDLRSLLSGYQAKKDWIEVGSHRFRLPTSRDVAVAVTDYENPVEQLISRCAINTDRHHWTTEEITAIEDRMAAADPLSEILLHFDCPDCGTFFDAPLELTSFLWAELEARAKRALHDVHVLARAYGWSEAAILSLPSARRQMYVEMVRA